MKKIALAAAAILFAAGGAFAENPRVGGGSVGEVKVVKESSYSSSAAISAPSSNQPVNHTERATSR